MGAGPGPVRAQGRREGFQTREEGREQGRSGWGSGDGDLGVGRGRTAVWVGASRSGPGLLPPLGPLASQPPGPCGARGAAPSPPLCWPLASKLRVQPLDPRGGRVEAC